MSELVLNYLNINNEVKKEKIILNRALTSKTKVVFLDRQVVKYFTNYDKYSDQKIIDFRNQVLSDYDKCSNVISLIAAFYEGGTGVFETEAEKRKTAILDLNGIEEHFKYAIVDQKYIFKKMKAATHAFTLDSGVQLRDKKYEAIIRKTYGIFIYLKESGFNGLEVIEQAKLLKAEMDIHKVCVGEPIAQYCFSLLTNYNNAKKIFKTKGLNAKTEEKAMRRRIYNAYADLRVFIFMHEVKSHLPNGVEVCFVSNDTPLNQFNSEFKKSVNKLLVKRNKLKQNTNYFNLEINFDVFNQEIFKDHEFEEFKKLFFKWSDT